LVMGNKGRRRRRKRRWWRKKRRKRRRRSMHERFSEGKTRMMRRWLPIVSSQRRGQKMGQAPRALNYRMDTCALQLANRSFIIIKVHSTHFCNLVFAMANANHDLLTDIKGEQFLSKQWTHTSAVWRNKSLYLFIYLFE
jgi:hypothetical protein